MAFPAPSTAHLGRQRLSLFYAEIADCARAARLLAPQRRPALRHIAVEVVACRAAPQLV